MSLYDNLNDVQLDVMREVSNIGAGNACTALSVLLGRPVDMSVPHVHIMGYEDTKNHIGGEDSRVLGLKVSVTDDLEGMMLQVVHKDFAELLINTFYPKSIASVDDLDDMDASVLNEMANITSGAYANSLASLTNMFVNIGTPDHVAGTIDEIMAMPLEKYIGDGGKVLVIDEQFLIDQEKITSNMLLVLESESLKKLLGRLGVEV